MANQISGVWFFGLSGSGKTYASNILMKAVDYPFLVDGDHVRKHISHDLGYDIASREVQIRRIFGISEIAIQNRYFPIASSVFMNIETLSRCESFGIRVVKLTRSEKAIKALRAIYVNESNVVGKDIEMPELKVQTIENKGNDCFQYDIFRILEPQF